MPLEGPGPDAADAPGVPIVLAPLLMVVAVGPLRLLGLVPLLKGDQLVIGFGRRPRPPRGLLRRPFIFPGPLYLPALPQSLARHLSVGLDHLQRGAAFLSGSAPARRGGPLGKALQGCLQVRVDCLGSFLELLAGALKDIQHPLVGYKVILGQLITARGVPHLI
jgi:hypothetical protein